MKFRIKRLMMLLALLSVTALVACGTKTDTTLVDAQAGLAIAYASGDSATAVTKNLVTLPAKVGEVTVTWVSSNAQVLTNAGVVTRPQADTPVSMTATLSYKDKTDTKVFALTVKAADGPSEADLNAAKVALEGHYAATLGDVNYEVLENLTLVNKILTFDVSWVSADTTLITNAGVVTRPAYSVDGGSTVKLTATITVKGQAVEVEFFAFVKGLEKTVQQTLEEAVNLGAAFSADVSIVGVSKNQTLLTSVVYDNETYAIVWTSSDPTVMSTTGVLTRPEVGEDDVVVTMTATITSGEVTASKEVEFKVLALVETGTYESLTELYTGDNAAKSKDYVKIKGVKVLGKNSDGVFVHDGTEIIFIYDSSVIYNTLVFGKVFDIQGEYDVRFGLPQLKQNGSNALTAVESTEVVADLPATVKSINALATKPMYDDKVLSYTYEHVRVTVKVIDEGIGAGSYRYWLTDENFEGTKVLGTTAGTYLTENVLMLYYKSNISVFEALNGQVVTIDLIMNGYRTDKFVWYGSFVGTEDDVEVAFASDADAVAAAKVAVNIPIPANIPEALSLDLVTSVYGTTIVWVSSNPAVINSTTGAVTPEVGTQVEVTLTATISKGGVTEDKVIVVKVGLVPLSTVETVVNADVNSTLYKVKALVTAGDSNNTYFLQEGDFGIAVYTKDAGFKAILDANVGKLVEVTGTKGLSGGLRQMTGLTEVKAVSGTATALPVSIDEVAWTNETLLPYQGRLVTLTNLRVKEIFAKDAWVNVTLERVSGGETLILRLGNLANITGDAKATFDALVAGDILSVTAPMAWYNGIQFLMTNQTVIVVQAVTPEAKVAEAAEDLNKVFSATEAGTIALPAEGKNSTVITYTFKNALDENNTLVNLVTGAVTMPTTGQVTVVLVAKVALGSVFVEVDVEVKLGVVATTVVTTIFAGETTNMVVDVNNAAMIGLNPLIFDVTTDSIGSYANKVGLNADGSIRLYADRGTGNGNTISVSTLGGERILQVKIIFGLGSNHIAGETSVLVTLGAQEVVLDSTKVKNVTETYGDLDISSFAIKNTTTGSKSGQIWIVSIEITYTTN